MRCAPLVSIAFLLTCGAVLLGPPEGSACGPFIPEAQFGYVGNPPPDPFLRGELGILKPQYYRRNLVVAYRYLSGAPLTAAEIRALTPAPPQTAPNTSMPALQPMGPDAARRWLEARNSVPGVNPVKSIEVYRNYTDKGLYFTYQNCLDEAFDAAAATLSARIRQWGATSPSTLDWLNAQDQVFANCSGPPPAWMRSQGSAPVDQPHVPAAAPAGADALLAADRQYQTAAALFYATKYDQAAQAFGAVAANSASPWSAGGRYLAARALIRKGTVDNDNTALAAAETALQAILADPAQARWHKSAQGLLDLVRGRLHPEERMTELGAALSKPVPGAGIAQAMTDYTMLWDRNQHGPAQQSDLADWITAFQQRNGQHALERWRASAGTVWLAAAVSGANPNDTAAGELIAAARRIPAPDPAYATLAWNGIRLEMGAHRDDDARAWAGEALAANLPTAAQNALHAERLRLARDWSDFLRDAPRVPVANTIDLVDEPIDPQTAAANPVPIFDEDSADAFNFQLPLKLWIDAASNPLLPAHLQAEIAQAAWMRAVLLNRTAEAGELARRTAQLHPELAAGMRDYASEKTGDTARFAAVFLMLHTPGLTPWLRAGFARTSKVADLDEFRDNWWQLGTAKNSNPLPAAFLDAARRAEGSQEWNDLLASAGTGPNYLCAQTLAWVQTHPQDPRVPEALHLAVRTTRYGQTDKQTSDYSRKCFQLLHARYGNTKWAQMTKYWY